MNKIIVLCLCLWSAALSAQDLFHQLHEWETEPRRYELKKGENEESFIYLKNKYTIEYTYNDSNNIAQYLTRHYKIRINDEKAIDVFNKVYIGVYEGDQIISVKARTITPKGKIITFDQRNLKEVENLEDRGRYKIFALEGVELGCDVEVMYTLKKDPFLYRYYVLQKSGLVKNAGIEIHSPENLKFETKVYNGKAEYSEEVKADKRIIGLHFDSIPGLEEEKYAAHENNLLRVHFKFKYNTNNSIAETFTYGKAAGRLYNIFYEDISRKNERKIRRILRKELDLKKEPERKQIIAIERYLKKNYVIKEALEDDDREALDFILEYHTTSEYGFVKLFITFLEIADIEHQLVVTSNRYKMKFDRDYMSWYYLSDFLIYFPEQNDFLAPAHYEYRYPMVPYQFTHQYGLFLKELEIDDYQTALPEINFIPTRDTDENFSNIEVDVHFEPEFKSHEIQLEHLWLGYSAMYIQPFYDYIDEKKKQEVIDNYIKLLGEDAIIKDREVYNHNSDVPPVHDPFIIEAKLELPSLLEPAGPDYLFKVGHLIGEQVEMYDENEDVRQSPVEIEYPHKLDRTISFNIPGGYQVKGLDKLKMDIQYDNEEGKPVMGFVSDYKIKQNKVEVHIHEYYHKINYPVEEYEHFREVINAAADFNRVVLAFEKKNK